MPSSRLKGGAVSRAESPSLPRWADLGGGLPPAMRLGLATRGNTRLEPEDIARAVQCGVNYLNWCGYDDGLARAVRSGLAGGSPIILAMQLKSRDAMGALREFQASFRLLGVSRIEVVTFYYVEHRSEWQQIIAPGGALETLREFQAAGRVSRIGLTTHQRRLGAECAESGNLDLLMIRYNAAHRGAEQDVFPLTARMRLPVVAYTAQRWGGLLKSTPGDPPEFHPPPAREWYRFVLSQPAVSVALMAPNGRSELEENLRLLEDWRAPGAEEFEALSAHGRRVRRHAGNFW